MIVRVVVSKPIMIPNMILHCTISTVSYIRDSSYLLKRLCHTLTVLSSRVFDMKPLVQVLVTRYKRSLTPEMRKEYN